MNELVQAYLAAEDTVIQDRAAYAIQESIKVMKLGSKSAGFSTDAQEVFFAIQLVDLMIFLEFPLGMSTFAFLTHCCLLILSFFFLYKSKGFEESREIVLHAKHEHQPEAIRHLPVVLESSGVFIPQLDL